MATINSTDTTATTATTTSAPTQKYHLPEEHRQAILAQSPAAIKRAMIEKKRLAFMQKFGDEYGLDQH